MTNILKCVSVLSRVRNKPSDQNLIAMYNGPAAEDRQKRQRISKITIRTTTIRQKVTKSVHMPLQAFNDLGSWGDIGLTPLSHVIILPLPQPQFFSFPDDDRAKAAGGQQPPEQTSSQPAIVSRKFPWQLTHQEMINLSPEILPFRKTAQSPPTIIWSRQRSGSSLDDSKNPRNRSRGADQQKRWNDRERLKRIFFSTRTIVGIPGDPMLDALYEEVFDEVRRNHDGRDYRDYRDYRNRENRENRDGRDSREYCPECRDCRACRMTYHSSRSGRDVSHGGV